ncbi:hypothetical protein [Paenibacillus soyae]|uniref:Lipoprotein n=1 Tax=Paenibacillus soyae TaxID=2969249 RepID=A0A9X2SA78_9BACL|nr:hypothetical protein [Paenibacillus soyae]MCR2805775.1 hypothetical protein [Paenibacillus soyae]
MKRWTTGVVAAVALSLSLAACAAENDANTNLNSNTNASSNANTPSNSPDAGQTEEQAADWKGEWQLEGADDSHNSVITITEQSGDKLTFSLDAFYLSNPDAEEPAPNIGNIQDGTAVIEGNTATFTDADLNFTLTMKLEGDKLTVTSTKDTGYFGHGVNVDGTYSQAN